MNALQREYDRFGPWVVEISEQDPPPRLFEPYLTRSEAPLLSVKIPRHLERRNARPDMDLYDYVVSVYDDDLVVLQRVGREVRSFTCRTRDVRSIRVTRCLLRGAIHLDLPERAVDLAYNTVSDAPMLRLVELVRQRYTRELGPALATPQAEVREGVLSFYFGRLLEAEGRHPTGMRLLAVQGTAPVASPTMSRMRRFALSLADKRRLEAMHLSDGRELCIMSRGATYACRWEAAYGLETTYIPIDRVRSVEWRPDPANLATNVILSTDAGDSVYAFATDNPSIEPYAEYLTSLPGLEDRTSARQLRAA